ncbi:hypothetical protein IJG89_01505 [Candidatus Saccharibacteria bacterium]|nr:hypothetical protein [Candidatus Saccharibacteria bacterium]
MLKKIGMLLVAVVLGGFCINWLDASAIDTSKMSHIMNISPPRQKIILMPGDVYKGSVNVSNSANATEDVKYSVSIGSFSFREDEDGNTDYNNTDVDTITSYNQIMEWITLDKTSGTVAPNEMDVLSYTITVPEDAPAGGQYATIIFQDDTGKDDEDNGNVVIENVVQFAATIIAEVAGETREEGLIIENSMPSFLLNNKLSTTATVRNNGNVHTDATFVLQVWPLFSDEEICTNEEEPSTSLIMPGTERFHSESCKNSAGDEVLLSPGIYKAKQTVKIFNEESVVEKTIIVCPLWLLFIIIFTIVSIVIWLVMRVRSKK